mgnify:CR=1 FL=1
MPWSAHRTASSAVTGTAAWRRIRAYVLTRDAYACQIQGPTCLGAATEVDKRIPVAQGGDPLDPSNLSSVCAPCHKAKTQQDARAGRATTRRTPEPHPGLLT